METESRIEAAGGFGEREMGRYSFGGTEFLLQMNGCTTL
jgi:hypothetical protein